MSAAYHLAFFDVDSTLVTIEGIDELAGGNPEIARLTEAAMDGSIAIDEVYGRRLEIIKPTSQDVMVLGSRYVASLLPDALSVFRELRANGVEIHLLSAGIAQAILPLADYLGLPERAVHAVKLLFDEDGRYRDFDRRSPLARSGGKELEIMNIRARTHGKAVMVGDGVSDLEAKGAVDLFIGFGGVRIREAVRAASPIYLTEPRLQPLVDIILRGTS
ncbi:MAG TPA: HAD-IB family phosphatase [Thermoanaerobaculia bacterium]|nr:HAD-IB family phosphatase [Thermoanaerobaculia bacterium]